jgi:hypothetical protein
MVPINISDVLINDLAAEFGCQIGSMPFTYLGIPLGTSKPHIIDLMPLACCLERRLACSSCFLSQLRSSFAINKFGIGFNAIAFLMFPAIANWVHESDGQNFKTMSLERQCGWLS